MGERRKWDKHAAATHDVPFVATAGGGGHGAAPVDAPSDPVLEKQVQYIKMLEERNRLKKKLAAASKKETRDKQREDAFVTTFNVPSGTSAAASTVAATGTHETVRKNKSSASLLPTKMSTHADARGRSAPSTTLPLRYTTRDDVGEDASEAKPDPVARRAKWSKPAAGEAFGVESRNGKARFCVGAKDSEATGSAVGGGTSHSGDDVDGESEDDYLEESFEEFEGVESGQDDTYPAEEKGKGHVLPRDPYAASFPPRSDEKASDEPPSDRAEAKHSTRAVVSTTDASSSSGLSRTTTDLFSVIQNLSRSKQKALVDVLTKFESSAQQESDVHDLRSSIGDPALWKQVTMALFGESALEVKGQQTLPQRSDVKAPALTIDRVMEEQRKWEEEYARQMQQRLLEEREAKEQALREAEQRRALLMQRMEEEEKELERLMEQKRLQRLARMKALEKEDETFSPDVPCAEAKKLEEAKEQTKAIQPLVAGTSFNSDLMSGSEGDKIKLDSHQRTDVEQSTISSSGTSGSERDIVPKLAFPSPLESTRSADGSSKIELRLRLLSTWGKTRAVGLTQICAYDVKGCEIDIDTSTVKVYEQPDERPLPKSHEMMRSIQRLFNGVAQTNNDQDMWLGRLSDHGMLEIAFEVGTQPSKLCVWNYNSKMCSACVRDLELLVGGKSVWSGSLPQGSGDEDDSICTWISVGQGAKKTARIATSRESKDQELSARHPTTASMEDSKATAHAASSQRSIAGATSVSDHPVSSGPIWLGSSRSSSVLPTSKLDLTKAQAKDELLQDLNSQGSKTSAPACLTSRRQRGDRVDQGESMTAPRNREEKRESKTLTTDSTVGIETVERDEFFARKDRERWSGTGALTSSWDSLEHFSKTSRSRLPSMTDELPQMTQPQNTPYELVKPRQIPTTTSALLTELRGHPHQGPSLLGADQPPSTYKSIEIPELPSGRHLRLEIVSTWGDNHYVGLNGIEIFDQKGRLVSFPNPDRQVVACPSSINVLEEYDDDPRVAKNLVDGVNCTCDDFHMWLAPFTQGDPHYLVMSFEQNTSVSMVRIWNYNKSRAHTYRGVRHIRLILLSETSSDQGRLIFEGEIRRAPGGLFKNGDNDNAMWCEVILFTTDQSILKKIETNDALLRAHGREEEEEEATMAIMTNVRSSMELQRPKTADTVSDPNNRSALEDEDEVILGRSRDADKRRPLTSAKRLPHSVDVRKSVDTWVAEEPQQKSPVLAKVAESKEDTDEEDDEGYEGLIRGRRITLRLLSTWGDKNYIGLSQVDVLVGNHGTPIPLDLSNIEATPRDLATLGYDGDPRTLDKLINGIGTTCDDANMWLVPFGANPEIRIDLKKEQYIYGIRVWNYNKSLEDSFRGVKQLAVTVDGELISPRHTGFVLRKAPGIACFDFDQIVRFENTAVGDKRDRAYLEKVAYPIQNRTYKTPNVRQDYEPPLYPQGFVLKLVLWATWGDPYYVGLNGIELYDANGKQITMKPTTVTAQPHSLADIDVDGSRQDDIRVPENLFSGKNKNTWDASDAWLAPLASSLGSAQGNIVFVAFDAPVVISLIKFWNYSKTPERGVKDMDIYLDDIHIFSGSLRKAPHGNSGQNIGRFGPKQLIVEEFSQPVLFSTNQAQVDGEKRRVYYCGNEEQDVLCINEGQVVQESKAMYRKPDPGAEGVVVDLGLRPMTAMGRK